MARGEACIRDWKRQITKARGKISPISEALLWKKEVDKKYFRPTEVETLLGDASKAKEKLGWKPKISFKDLVSEMVKEDLKLAKRDQLILKNS